MRRRLVIAFAVAPWLVLLTLAGFWMTRPAPSGPPPTATVGLVAVSATQNDQAINPTRTLVPTIVPTPLTIRDYTTQMQRTIANLRASIGRMTALIGNAKTDDAQWKTRLAVELLTIQNIYTAIEGMQSVPRDATLVHLSLIKAAADCDQGTKKLAQGVDVHNVALMRESEVLMLACNTQLDRFMPGLDALK